jgi:hypothetical protein
MYGGFQDIFLPNPVFQGHHIHGLHSSYQTRWIGPWIGLDGYYHCNEDLTFTGILEYHWAQYKGEGHWNLRRDFPRNFKHNGFGRGWVASMGVEYTLCNGWYLLGALKFDYLRTTHCTDTTWAYTYNEELETFEIEKYKGKIRKVFWRSAGISVGASYVF